MGALYKYRCQVCQYTAQVSGTDQNAGELAHFRTIYCLDCNQLHGTG